MSNQKVTPSILTDAQRIHLELVWEVLDDLSCRSTPSVFTSDDQEQAQEALTDLLHLMGFSKDEVEIMQGEQDDDIIDDEFEGDPSWSWTLPEQYRY